MYRMSMCNILRLYNGYAQHNATVYCAYLRHSSVVLDLLFT